MLLLTMQEWFGSASRRDPRLAKVDTEVRQRAFVTRLPLAEALDRIHAYEEAHNARYARATALEFALLTVVTIDDLDERRIQIARVVFVETLDSSPGEMNERLG